MSEHPHEDRLHDLIEGALGPDERKAIEAHLAGCVPCRAEVAYIHELLAGLAALPRSVAPPRDLRPGIWQQIDAEDDGLARGVEAATGAGVHGQSAVVAVRPRFGHRTLVSARWPLAAAAVLIVVLTSAITMFLEDRTAGPSLGGGVADATPGETFTASDVSAVESRYLTATQELQQLLDEQRAQLSPETVRLLEENLLLIDRALLEVRDALAIQPGDADLSRILFATWEKKLDLLR
jgi:predicted anti-sigma-YlaC factor YlaD